MREHFDPSRFCDHPAMQTPSPRTEQPLLVACLCAQWCGTCKDYAPLFEGLMADFPGATFRWIDIEDESDLVDPRYFSYSNIKNRLESFFQMLEQRKMILTRE